MLVIILPGWAVYERGDICANVEVRAELLLTWGQIAARNVFFGNKRPCSMLRCVVWPNVAPRTRCLPDCERGAGRDRPGGMYDTRGLQSATMFAIGRRYSLRAACRKRSARAIPQATVRCLS
jgi:hypothetical protein